MKKLVSFDLDMTLLDHKTYKIPESAILALKELKQKGHILVIATGRDMDTSSSKYLIEDLDIDARLDLNGTKIIVNNECIYSHYMNEDLKKRLLDYSIKKGYCIGLTVGEYDYYTNHEVLDKLDFKKFGRTFRKYANYKELYNMKVRTFAYVGYTEGVYDIEKNFSDLKLCLFSSEEGADIIEKTESKAKGLKILSKYLGIDMKNTIAFGDSMNDLDIIKEAGVGIAMGNASEKVKEVADYITDAIDKDGIYNALKNFKLI